MEAIIKSSLKTRDELIQISRERMNEELDPKSYSGETIFLMPVYNPEYPGLKEIVLANWDLLKRSQAMKVLAKNTC